MAPASRHAWTLISGSVSRKCAKVQQPSRSSSLSSVRPITAQSGFRIYIESTWVPAAAGQRERAWTRGRCWTRPSKRFSRPTLRSRSSGCTAGPTGSRNSRPCLGTHGLRLRCSPGPRPPSANIRKGRCLILKRLVPRVQEGHEFGHHPLFGETLDVLLFARCDVCHTPRSLELQLLRHSWVQEAHQRRHHVRVNDLLYRRRLY